MFAVRAQLLSCCKIEQYRLARRRREPVFARMSMSRSIRLEPSNGFLGIDVSRPNSDCAPPTGERCQQEFPTLRRASHSLPGRDVPSKPA